MLNNINISGLNKEQVKTLYKIAQLLGKTELSSGLIEKALDWVVEVINAERAVFARYMNESGTFEIISARNIKKESIKDLTKFSSGVLNQVVSKKQSILYHDVQSDPHVSQFESIKVQQIKSVMGVPIFFGEQIWGVILADCKKNRSEFNKDSLGFMQFLSGLLSLALDRILRIEQLKTRTSALKNELEQIKPVPDMIGQSKAMKKLAILVHKVADTNATVLITGESGTGKDIAARAIHKLSNRKDHPFLAQFCGSIPDSLLESELFGYKKGAFTGAATDKTGLFETANHGTFFLDEIADISSALQAKLLRVIQHQEIIRLGDSTPRKIDVRIITATNKDLEKLVEEGRFREDLFYRLNVFPIHIPPLRERMEDLALLAQHFLTKYSTDKHILTSEALEKLQSFSWPGNIRQLENTIQRSLILAEGPKILAEHIVLEKQNESIGVHTKTLKEIENAILIKRLALNQGHKLNTAKSLGVSLRWVQMRLKEIESQSF